MHSRNYNLTTGRFPVHLPGLGLQRIAFVILVLATSPPALAQRKNPGAAPVLLLSGGQREHHGYRDQALSLARSLEETGRYRVTIVEDAAVLETDAITGYRAIILLADRRDPEFKLSPRQQIRLLEYVHDLGRALVSIHAADNAAPDWLPEMRKMLGGVFSHDTTGGRPDGKVRKGDYRVTIRAPGHPVCQGLADFDLKDELYYQVQMEPGVEPLATVAYDGKDWPVAWTRTYGAGRVFHTVLGHRDFGPDKEDPLQNPGVRKLLEQGLAWALVYPGDVPVAPPQP
jgi:type 1 glutamine amidotransferase